MKHTQRNRLLILLFSLLSMPLMPADRFKGVVSESDASPAGFMERLLQTEAASSLNEIGTFNLQRQLVNGNASYIYSMPRRHRLDEELKKYLYYFRALAQSTRLTDAEKLQPEFVLIPYFRSMQTVEQLKRMEHEFSCHRADAMYPLIRLFVAAVDSTARKLGSCSSFSMHMSLDKQDIDLTRRLLRKGVELNEDGSLMFCTTSKQAKLLIAHGADLERTNKRWNLLNHSISSDADLLAFYLACIPLGVENRFGKNLYVRLVARIAEKKHDDFDRKLQILLDSNCYYDEEEIIETGLPLSYTKDLY